MISERLNSALNSQISKEFHSAYLYLSMSNYLCGNGLHGFGHWCKKQAAEEVEHGMNIFNFMSCINGKIELMQIASPESIFHSPLEVAKQILVHEKQITEAIRNIAVLAKEENAFTIQNFLESMLKEQIEEEDISLKIYTQLKLYGDSKSTMYLIDKELSERK